jgi:hypothetical protein
MSHRVQKTLFMLRKLFRDVTRERKIYELSADVHSHCLREYYFLFNEERLQDGKDQALIHRFDEKGIPVNRTYIDVKDKEFVYFPISIGQVGLAVFHTFLETRSDADKNRFLNFVEWFQQNVQVSPEMGARWLTDVSLPQYRNTGPWQSAFAQSRGISILLRGYQLTHQVKYSEMAELALIPFCRPVAEGGVTSFTSAGPFYEEYTAEVPTLVLNGMIFSLFGLFDFCRVHPAHRLGRELASSGIDTLIKILPQFDLGFWSRYNLCQADWYPRIDPSTISYHNLHILQLTVLFHITHHEIFRRYAEIMSRQIRPWNLIHSLLLKYRALKKLNRI